MKISRLISITFFILIVNSSFGQLQKMLDTIASVSPFNYSYIKFSPFALIEIEPTLQFGYEHNLTPK